MRGLPPGGTISDTTAAIRKSGVVLCVRERDPGTALAAARAALDGGLAVLEVTFTTPEAPELMSELAKDPRAVVGAGTVLTADDVRLAANAGARFALSPVTDEDVVKCALERGLLVAPGAATPNEIWRAHRSGAPVVKVFPIGPLGGALYIRAIRGPFPEVDLLPTNGVGLESIRDYFDAGVFAVGIGREVMDPVAIARRDFAEVTRRAARFADLVRELRK